MQMCKIWETLLMARGWHNHISHHPTLVATADPAVKLRLYGFQILGPLDIAYSFFFGDEINWPLQPIVKDCLH
jgi:hypothetical protein